LVDVTRKYPRDTSAASSALFLMADLSTDRQQDADARKLFRRVATRYPSSHFAPAARFRAAIIVFTTGEFGQAAAELDALVKRYPTSEEALAALYWAGRAFASAGDSVTAASRWEAAARRDSLSYYASLSARRLGRTPWLPAPAADSFIRVSAFDSVIDRARLLTRLGLRTEAQFEFARLIDLKADTVTVEHLLAAADALRRADRASDAVQLARRALARGAAADARVYRLLYPVIHRDALVAEAGEQRLDPNFVAALIRQESRFNPAATSSVGARGLMQIMPQVGAGIARTRGYPVWDPVLLYQPDVSLQLGVSHLRELTDRYTAPVRILAAYNAGASRVDRWSQKPGADDPELFVERIPFAETRDYVRIIQRNQEIYQTLYR
jgi:soluble lytic murein transglycosylase